MKGFYFVLVPGVIFLKVVCVCVCVYLHLFIRMFPTGLAVMRPVEPRSDGVQLIRTTLIATERKRERKVAGKGRNKRGMLDGVKRNKATRIMSK